MKKMHKGLTVPKWVLIVKLKILQIPNLSVQAQKFGISMKKGFIGCPKSVDWPVNQRMEFQKGNSTKISIMQATFTRSLICGDSKRHLVMLKAYILFILKALDTTMDIKGQIITGIYYCFQWAGKKHFKADGKFNRLCTNYRLKCLSHHFFSAC